MIFLLLLNDPSGLVLGDSTVFSWVGCHIMTCGGPNGRNPYKNRGVAVRVATPQPPPLPPPARWACRRRWLAGWKAVFAYPRPTGATPPLPLFLLRVRHPQGAGLSRPLADGRPSVVGGPYP
jgi:hypothetical protein